MLEKINVHGVENLIDFCKNNGRRLIQISTVSVAGEGSEGIPPKDRVFCENDLYIGQSITNEYIRTKFWQKGLYWKLFPADLTQRSSVWVI